MPTTMPVTSPKKANVRTKAALKLLRTAMANMELPTKASMDECIAAGKTLDCLLAAQNIQVEEVVTNFKDARKQASTSKKPTAPAA